MACHGGECTHSPPCQTCNCFEFPTEMWSTTFPSDATLTVVYHSRFRVTLVIVLILHRVRRATTASPPWKSGVPHFRGTTSRHH